MFFQIIFNLDCIHNMLQDYLENNQPVSDDSQLLHRFCAKLEFLLQAGLKCRFDRLYYFNQY